MLIMILLLTIDMLRLSSSLSVSTLLSSFASTLHRFQVALVEGMNWVLVDVNSFAGQV